MLDRTTAIAVAGAGSIGCYAAALAAAWHGGPVHAAGPAADRRRRPQTSGSRSSISTAGERKLWPVGSPGDDRSGGGVRRRRPRPGDGEERRHARNGAAHRPPRAAGCDGRQPAERHRQCGTSAAIASGRAARGRRHGAVQRRPGARRRTAAWSFGARPWRSIIVEAGVPGLVDLLNVEGFPVAVCGRHDCGAVGQAGSQPRAMRSTRCPACRSPNSSPTVAGGWSLPRRWTRRWR